MQAIDNKVIIYDDVCPMCAGYTAGFVKLGWLKYRAGFAQVNPELLGKIDLDRARHEIPLHDTVTGETIYGLDAFFFVIKNRFPMLQPLLDSALVRRPTGLLYKIITYNRRVIAGTHAPQAGFDCAPDVNFFYRRLYVVLALVAAGLLWWRVWPETDGWLRETLFLHGVVGLGVLGGTALRRLNYAGHWATVLLLTGLLAAVLPAHPVTGVGLLALSVWCWWHRRDLV